MSATLESNVALDNTFGAMLVGVIISAVLHGISLLQAFVYFTKYKKDAWYNKVLVATTITFDTIHQIMITHTIYYYLVSNFRNPDNLHRLVWSVLMEALFTGVNGAIVQSFYTYRLWRLSKGNMFLPIVILILIALTASSGTVWVVLSMRLDTFQELLKISPLTITINALTTSVDVLLAVSLVYMLQKARTGFKRSNMIINQLIIFVVNTGMLTTICAIAALISLITSPNSLIYAAFYFCIGRMYTNSFLATLNARRSTSSSVDDVSHMMVSLPTSGGHINPGTTSRSRNQTDISIRIDTTKEAILDSDMERTLNQSDLNATSVAYDARKLPTLF